MLRACASKLALLLETPSKFPLMVKQVVREKKIRELGALGEGLKQYTQARTVLYAVLVSIVVSFKVGWILERLRMYFNCLSICWICLLLFVCTIPQLTTLDPTMLK